MTEAQEVMRMKAVRLGRGAGVVCVNCGARLDPGERCDCERQETLAAQGTSLAALEDLCAKDCRAANDNARRAARAAEEWLYG